MLIANRVVLGDLELTEVLDRIVIAARELTQAHYGALSVIDTQGKLEQFVQSGVDEHTSARIGRLPEGHGLLGDLAENPKPTSINDVSNNPRSAGFPDAHQQMSSFLSVPVRVSGQLYGNLYVAESKCGEFSPEDLELAKGLAATAGIAIENARLYSEANHRQEWLHASAEVTRQLLTESGEYPLRLIARQAQRLADADAATVVVPTADNRALTVTAASGNGVSELEGRTFAFQNTFAALVVDKARPMLIDAGNKDAARRLVMAEQLPVGPVMLLPLLGSHGVRGALTIGRLRGRAAFTEADLEMANTFANQAAVALELADARFDQERMRLLEERDMLARDLHDHVIQRLFAVGLTLQSVSAGLARGDAPRQLAHIVTEFDDTIRQIRASIFALGGLRPRTTTIQARVLAIVGEIRPILGFEPEIHLVGPLDTAVPDLVCDDVIAVLREALTNTARHANASSARVEVIASPDELRMEIIDDGVGIGPTRRRSGLANLHQRAAQHGGALTIVPPAPTAAARAGTHLRWTVPL
ncbi:sensor histidine kinase [Mycolicibacterium fortuitum]|uniref:sensor histidine kinase n=1 Tax=Mycolicibacterium fortuitum TaxID=1766 RepID=UPI001CE1132B|nr:GAF domain-containing protein [Mycolicibacterium fortuitum]MCA4726605.1 GAF domain-containing protein [Mycolicibacterium fortuitum]